MQIGIAVGEVRGPASVDDSVAQAETAAARGFASIWSTQLFGLDALTALAVIGREVPGVPLGTAIVPTYPRHPMALASQALTVQSATGNRLTLGIGPSHQVIIEGNYGISFERPARHIREYLTALGPLLRGETVEFAGETLSASGSLSVPGTAAPSVLLSALGPVMLGLAGELTDGTVTANTGIRTIGDYIVPTITRAAANAGRPAPRVAALMSISVSNDPAARRAEIADRFGTGIERFPSYRAILDREGVAGPEGVAIVGDEAVVEGELRRLADAGATDLIAIPFGPDEDQTRTIELLSSLAGAMTPHATAR